MELKAHGVGNATADPELKFLPNNTGVCNVTLAFNRSFKKGDEWVKETTYMRVQMFGKRAEQMAEKVKKGTPVMVDGYIIQNNWETDDGEKRTMLLMTARDFAVCERFSKNGNNENSDKNTKKAEVPVNSAVAESDDDIPF